MCASQVRPPPLKSSGSAYRWPSVRFERVCCDLYCVAPVCTNQQTAWWQSWQRESAARVASSARAKSCRVGRMWAAETDVWCA